MTPKEFKAWFDGFTEAMEGTPTVKQWARIKERVAEIDGRETTIEIYRDRYIRERPWQPYFSPYAVYLSNNTGAVSMASPATQMAAARPSLADMGVGQARWNGTDAMFALGKADAEAIS